VSGAVPQQPAFAAVKAREEAEEQREVLSKKKKTGSRRGNGGVDTRHDDGEILQHRQLHRLFTSIRYTAIYLLHCVYAPPILLCVSLDCSADGVSPPSGAIRN